MVEQQEHEASTGPTMRELVAAVDTLARFVTLRWTPSQPLTLAELTRAVAVLQRHVAHLARFLRASREAAQLHQARPGIAPDLPACAHAVVASMQFLDAFGVQESETLTSLAELLGELQAGRRKLEMSGLPPGMDGRRHYPAEARLWGFLACALDARFRADPTNTLRRHAALLAVEAAALGVKPTALAKNLLRWRERCMAGMRGDPIGFKRGHPAHARWAQYQREVLQGGRYRARKAADWQAIARVLLAQVARLLPANPRAEAASKIAPLFSVSPPIDHSAAG